ncbi:MAG: hypothetical protein IPJ00_02190 [Saprospirales bacterium]|nr:hypothetical protein [Saprospirales bacterium]
MEIDKELATFKFQHGQAPMVDAIRADIMIDEVKTGIILLEQKRKPLELAFNRLLDRDDTLSVQIAGSLPEPVSGAPLLRDSLLSDNPWRSSTNKYKPLRRRKRLLGSCENR